MRNVVASVSSAFRLLPALAVLCLAARPARADRLYLPGVANTAGKNETRFESSVFIVSLAPGDSTVTIGLIPAAPVAAPSPVTRPIRSGETLVFANVILDLFGLDGTFGTLAVSCDQPCEVRGTTANVKDPFATYGLGLTPVAEDAVLLAGETGHAVWLSNAAETTSGYRTNVTVALLAPDSSVFVTIHDEAGFVRGAATVGGPLPLTWQSSVAALTGDPAIFAGRVTLEVLRGEATGYTSVVDNVTGDGIEVLAERLQAGPADLLLDGASRTAGVNGTHWSTDLRVFNPGLAPLLVTLDALGFAGTPPSLTRTVGPRGTLEIGDVLGPGGFDLTDGVAGAVRLRAEGPLLAAGRTSNVDPSGVRPGSFGAQQRPVPFASGLIPPGGGSTLAGLTHTGSASGFRTNVALFGGSSGASGTLVLRDARGAESARTPFTLSPLEWRQRSLPAWFGAGFAAPGSRVDVAVSAGSADAYASVVDNVTGDSVVVAAPPVPTAHPLPPADLPPTPGLVRTASGDVRGIGAGGTFSWKGIPHAAPPLGPLRFRPPVAPEPWSGVRDASSFGPVCLQFNDAGQLTGSEDCLTLNVWAPAVLAAGPAPVLFWIHGGGNVQGSGSASLYDGQPFAERNGVVVVTINYRLSALGFLAVPALDAESARGVSGNYGLLDQIAALSWVRRNIAAFGGDRSRVMIFGESAGAVDVCALMASPLAKGLFARAAMESGGCNQETLAQVEAFGRTVVSAAGCAAASDVAACLRGLSAEAVTSAVPGQANVISSSGILYGPNVDGFVLRESPASALADGTHHHVPFLVGSNADETARFAPALPTEAAYQAAVIAQFGGFLGPRILAQYPASSFASPQKAFIAVTTDARFVCPSRRFARAAALSQDEPVYRYFFTKSVDSALGAFYGAYHGLEIPFVFRTLTGIPGFTPSASELALADALNRYWARFGASGDPNAAGAVSWPRYDAAADTYLGLDNTIVPGAGVRTGHCDFWDSLVPSP